MRSTFVYALMSGAFGEGFGRQAKNEMSRVAQPVREHEN